MSMATVSEPTDAEPRVTAVFDDIRTTRGTDYINNFWRYLTVDPALLRSLTHRGSSRAGYERCAICGVAKDYFISGKDQSPAQCLAGSGG